MRLVNKQDFLDMPVGTVYQKAEPYVTDDGLCVKGESIGDYDWFYTNLDFISILGDSRDIATKFTAMQAGQSVEPAIYPERDGLYDEDDMFLVLEPDDVDTLISVLKEEQ